MEGWMSALYILLDAVTKPPPTLSSKQTYTHKATGAHYPLQRPTRWLPPALANRCPSCAKCPHAASCRRCAATDVCV